MATVRLFGAGRSPVEKMDTRDLFGGPWGGFVTRRAIVWTRKELGYDGGWLLRLALTIMITKYNDFFSKTKVCLSTMYMNQ